MASTGGGGGYDFEPEVTTSPDATDDRWTVAAVRVCRYPVSDLVQLSKSGGSAGGADVEIVRERAVDVQVRAGLAISVTYGVSFRKVYPLHFIGPGRDYLAWRVRPAAAAVAPVMTWRRWIYYDGARNRTDYGAWTGLDPDDEESEAVYAVGDDFRSSKHDGGVLPTTASMGFDLRVMTSGFAPEANVAKGRPLKCALPRH